MFIRFPGAAIKLFKTAPLVLQSSSKKKRGAEYRKYACPYVETRGGHQFSLLLLLSSPSLPLIPSRSKYRESGVRASVEKLDSCQSRSIPRGHVNFDVLPLEPTPAGFFLSIPRNRNIPFLDELFGGRETRRRLEYPVFFRSDLVKRNAYKSWSKVDCFLQ